MSEKSFILSSEGLKNVVETKNEFIFIFGKCEIRMSSIFAEFISPLVSRLHHSDPTIDTIHYDYPSNTNFPQFEELFTEEMINFLQQISKGYSISINSEQATKMQQISILLCNNELFNIIQKLYPQEVTNDNFDEYLTKLKLFQYQSIINTIGEDIDFTALIDLISSNFYQIDVNKLKSLSKPILFKIISNEHIKIESEDSLFEFINEIFNNCENDSQEIDDNEITINDFYEEIEFVGLSEEKFKEFVVLFDPTKMTNSIWNNLCSRFLNRQSNDDRYRYCGPKVQKFLFNGNESDSFHGIIHHMTKECGGNVSDKGVVSVSSYPEESSNPGKNSVDFEKILYTNNFDAEPFNDGPCEENITVRSRLDGCEIVYNKNNILYNSNKE